MGVLDLQNLELGRWLICNSKSNVAILVCLPLTRAMNERGLEYWLGDRIDDDEP